MFCAYCRLFGYPELAGHRRYRLVREALAGRVSSRVVDVGTRNGLYALAEALSRPQTSYIGIDISQMHLRRLGLAVKQFGLRLHPLAARAEALSLPSESADVVLTIEVLQFVDDDRRAVEEIGRILRTGGLWWCEQELEIEGRVTATVDDPTLTKRRPGHSVQRLTELARSAGMELVNLRRVDGPVGRWWERLEARIRERSRGWHLLAFPALRLLAALTANQWTERVPCTVLYCFEKRP